MYPEGFRHLYARNIVYKGRVWRMIQKLHNSHVKQECIKESGQIWVSVKKLKQVFDTKDGANQSVDTTVPEQKFEGRENGTGTPIKKKIENSTQISKKSSTCNVNEAQPNGKILQTFDKSTQGNRKATTKLINREKISRSIKTEEKNGYYETYKEEATSDEIAETLTRKFEKIEGGKRNAKARLPDQGETDCSVNAQYKKLEDRCKMSEQKLKTLGIQDDYCEIYRIQDKLYHYLSKQNISKQNQLDIVEILETLSSELDAIDSDKINAVDIILETIQLQMSRFAGLYMLEKDSNCLERWKMLHDLDREIRQEKSELYEKSSLKDRLRSLMSKESTRSFQLWSSFRVVETQTDKDLDIQNIKDLWSYRWNRESLTESTHLKILDLEKTLENITNKLDMIESKKQNAIDTFVKSIRIRELRLAAKYLINLDENYRKEIDRLDYLDQGISQLRENTKCQRNWDIGAHEKEVTSLTNSLAKKRPFIK
ncbi:hypothetical protein QYM36_016096 [Artemia franciscana]|uniref:Uncharacterized protein n=1 Tax=Artemia franciscana TaxID=6661 RepID=A0AA88L313_ARTSF|nr:hypothetical protein QYM36_016096 [Artemia franciscana]